MCFTIFVIFSFACVSYAKIIYPFFIFESKYGFLKITFEKVEFAFHFQTNFNLHIVSNVFVMIQHYVKFLLFDIHVHKYFHNYFWKFYFVNYKMLVFEIIYYNKCFTIINMMKICKANYFS